MKLIIISTNRKNSLSSSLSLVVKSIYEKLGEKVEILDLKDVPFKDMVEDSYSETPSSLKPYLDKVAQAEGLILICPEYNGGIPGLIKHFIDYWIYPDSFVYKPVCLIGLGGKFGGLTPITQLQNIFLYRHSFVFPIRVFVQNVSENLKKGDIQDKNIKNLLIKQAKNFTNFIKAIQTQTFE